MKILLLLLLSSACRQDSPKQELTQKHGIVRKVVPEKIDTVWDLSDVYPKTTKEDRVKYLLNEDSAYRYKRKGYDGRFYVHNIVVKTNDTIWYSNGEREDLMKKLKDFSINFPNTRFFVRAFNVEILKNLSKRKDVVWVRKSGYSIWFKNL